jgi:hypothetical protein
MTAIEKNRRHHRLYRRLYPFYRRLSKKLLYSINPKK